MTTNRPLFAALIASLLFASTRVHAQTYAPANRPSDPQNYAPPNPPIAYAPAPQPIYYGGPLVPMALEGDVPGMTYEVMGPKGDDRIFGRCVSPCTLQLPPGAYRVRVEGESIPSTSQKVILEGATRVYSEAGSKSAKNGGLVTAIAGTSVAGIALAIALLSAMSAPCSWGDCGSSISASQQKQRDQAATTADIALGVAAIGALVGTIGWITFASGRTKMHVEGGYGPTFRFGVTPTVGGAAFGLSGTF